ncbi:MAG: UvrD-helicase domain-containing protein [Bacteroidales bacterium]|jgi:ATP-dependent exoDNAse (exonuclease V) beta subunit|nr:UvrD-helicase domain-containing protein [Bacteroidales bacterium]
MIQSNFLVYRASAGSGKTYTLAQQYIKQLLIHNPRTAYRHILAVTFTNDAAGEMKNRILDYLHELADDNDADFLENLRKELPDFMKNNVEEIQQRARVALQSILHDYSNFHVTTIDSFFQTIARDLAKELGIGSRFDIEINTELPIKDAVKEVIENATTQNEVLGKLTRFVEHKLEDDKWSIERDLQSFSRFIFNEIFQKNEDALMQQFQEEPEKIRETIKICKQFIVEYETRMQHFANCFFEKRLPENDFYYKGKGVPGYFKKIKNKEYEAPNTYVLKVLSGDAGNAGDMECIELLQAAENYRTGDRLLKYNTSKLFLKFIYQLELLKDISDKISEQNAEQNRFILSHTNQLLSGLIGDEDTSFVYEKIGAQIRSVIIDEFQDTSELQWRNFKVLISEILATNGFGMLVGDVKQSIYRWRNGNWKILNDIDQELKEQVRCLSLQTNYRSAEQVIDFNNQLFKQAAANLQNNESDEHNPFRKAYQDVVQQSTKKAEGFVSVDFAEIVKVDNTIVQSYEESVLEKVADKIKLLLDRGVKQGDICILCRANKQIRLIAHDLPGIFARRFPDCQETIRIISEDAYRLGSSRSLNVLVSALRLIHESRNPVPAAQLLLQWKDENINELSLEKIAQMTAEIQTQQTLPLYDLIETLCRKFCPGSGADVLAFMDKLTDYLSRNVPDLGKFLDYWDERLSIETLPLPVKGQREHILAMSIHKSKGLQFHTVIVPFVDWAMAAKSTPSKPNVVWCESMSKEPPFQFPLLPIEYSSLMENSYFSKEYETETHNLQMDNLNVLYVALTRAEKNLLVLTKQKPKNSKTSNIQDFIISYIGDKPYEIGKIEPHDEQQVEEICTIDISFHPRKPDTTVFPSTEAQIFARGDNEDKIQKVKTGNIIHLILENITHIENEENIENAVKQAIEKLIIRGELSEAEKTQYLEIVKTQIANSRKWDWFSNKYNIHNETAILMDDGRENRPDRVLVDGDGNVTVIDYKTGETKPGHIKQVENYMALLSQMQKYRTIKGYVWYLSENQIIEIEADHGK